MDKITKQEAIKRLEAIEKETQQLKEIINAPDKKDWRFIVDLKSACEFLGTSNFYLDTIWKDLLPRARAILTIQYIADAINEGWEASVSGNKKTKYYPWFDISRGSLRYMGILDSGQNIYGQIAYFSSKEKAEHAGEHLIGLYSQVY